MAHRETIYVRFGSRFRTRPTRETYLQELRITTSFANIFGGPFPPRVGGKQFPTTSHYFGTHQDALLCGGPRFLHGIVVRERVDSEAVYARSRRVPALARSTLQRTRSPLDAFAVGSRARHLHDALALRRLDDPRLHRPTPFPSMMISPRLRACSTQFFVPLDSLRL